MTKTAFTRLTIPAILAGFALAGCGGAGQSAVPVIEVKGADAGSAGEGAYAEVAVFLLPRCPHAALVMQTLLDLRREMGPSLNLLVGYVGVLDDKGNPSFPGGDAEKEAARVQICASRHADPEPWIRFLECQYRGEAWRTLPDGWESCVKEAGVPLTDVKKCLSDGEGSAVLGTAVAATTLMGIDASPTLIVNGSPYVGGRTRTDLLRMLCYLEGAPNPRPAVCEGVEPPPAVAATLLFDSRCKDEEMCDTASEEAIVGNLVPGVAFKRVDYVTDEGRRTFELVRAGSGVSTLPLIVLEKTVAAERAAMERLADYLTPFGDGYVLRLGGWDPTVEICDNAVDDNGDNAVDCADSTCSPKPLCRAEVKARLDLFIMSGCPFADRMLPEVDRFLDGFGRDEKVVSFALQFIGENKDGELTSMHGAAEVEEDRRMACAQKLYASKYEYMKYVVCRAGDYKAADWAACVPKGMDKKKIEKCASGEEGEKLVADSFALADQVGKTGSPSWLLNNRDEMQGRDAASITEDFCEKNPLPGCKAALERVSEQKAKGPSGDDAAGDNCE
ncbi:MAG: hypothetical protein PHU25_11955 [Deltaproteobacteria bacterium]|nr:hypothetical protein [Deltaproteobacteria bacterium]